MDAEVVVTFAAAVGQLGIAAAAMKVALELKAAVLALKEQFANHEKRITKLEDK
jgi:hypothetical protein